MIDVSIPPYPELAGSTAYAVAAACVTVGVLLGGWGRVWSRPVTAAVGVCVGLLLAGPVAEQIEVDLLFAQVALASVLGVLGFVAAPVFWSLLASCVCVSVAVWLLAADYLAETNTRVPMASAADMGQWLRALGGVFGDLWSALWSGRRAVTVMVVVPSGAVPLLIGLWRRRLMTIVMTSLTGPLVVVAGVMIAVTQSDPSRWPASWAGMRGPLIVAGSLAFCSTAFQYGRIIAAARKEKQISEQGGGQKKSSKAK